MSSTSRPYPQSSDPVHTESTISTEHPHQSPPDIPFLCRRPVRITVYTGFALLGVFMLTWGYLPILTDPTFENHIKNKQVVVGMTRQQALEAWGSPYQMNVTYTDRGARREEWVFEDWIDAGSVRHKYLYFEEGKLQGGWYYE